MAAVNQRVLQPSERVRVMVVDDSMVIRRLVTQALEHDPTLDVVGTASNGAIGLQRMPQLNPDLITPDRPRAVMSAGLFGRALSRNGVVSTILRRAARDQEG